MKCLTKTDRLLTIALLTCLLPILQAEAKKPPNPPGDGGGTTAAYTVVDLGEHQSVAVAVSEPNEEGNVIVGGMSWTDSRPHPVVWDVAANGTFLPPFHLDLPPGASEASITGMNDAGVVVLKTQGAGGGWYYTPGAGYGRVPYPGSSASVFAINNFGDVVGDADITSVGGWWEGALWLFDNGGYVDPIPLGTFAPNDINDFGLMVGDAYNVDTGRLEAAAAWFDVAGLHVEFLGVLPGTAWSEAVAVSSDGTWIVGSSQWNAFVWSADTGMIPLGTLGGYDSTALDVNSAGQVVGYSATTGAFSQAAFVWQNGTMIDLNDLAATGHKPHLSWATSISERGYITGITRTSRRDSHEHGYVLIPKKP